MADDALTFLAVCRHGSFLAAGQAIGVATSTVSRRVDQLEERLGAKVFERSTRGLTLTEAGRLFAERASVAESALVDAEDAVRALMMRPAGRLRVAAPSGLVREVVADVALDYLAAYPDVSLEIVGTDEDVVPDGREVHLVLRVSNQAPPEHLIQRALGRVPMVVCAAPAWVAEHGRLDDPEDLEKHGCVVLGSDVGARRIRLHRGDDVRRLSVPIALFTTSISMARRAALAGAGPCGLPVSSCVSDLRAGRLVRLVPGWSLASVPVVVLFSGDRQVPLRLRAFVDLLVDAFAQMENSSAMKSLVPAPATEAGSDA